jgi:hypothetical protein
MHGGGGRGEGVKNDSTACVGIVRLRHVREQTFAVMGTVLATHGAFRRGCEIMAVGHGCGGPCAVPLHAA